MLTNEALMNIDDLRMCPQRLKDRHKKKTKWEVSEIDEPFIQFVLIKDARSMFPVLS